MPFENFDQRIAIAAGVSALPLVDRCGLSGFFNRYRPNGDGLDQLFQASGVEGEILSRLKQVFQATAPGWEPSDWYFTIRQHEPVDLQTAASIANDYLSGFKALAEHVGHAELVAALDRIRITTSAPAEAAEDPDLEILLYECLTDFWATLETDRNGVFLLKEALYSMANDYFLAAYILCPACDLPSKAANALDKYFDVWRHGVRLIFFTCGGVRAMPQRLLPHL